MKTGWAKLAVLVLGVLLLTSTAIEGPGSRRSRPN